MDDDVESDQAMRARPLGLIAYAAAWFLAGAAVAALTLVALRDDDAPTETLALDQAARVAGCQLRGPRRVAGLNPPVDGPRVRLRPPRALVYRRPLRAPLLLAAVQQGSVVIQYRPRLAAARVTRLRRLYVAGPARTLLVPNATRMRFAIAAVGRRRLLGCPEASDAAFDAVRVFRLRVLRLASGP